jgi:hypothetical protein
MPVTVVSRWTTPNVEASTQATKQARAIWMKNGALDLRLSQIFTGPYTGQWLIAVVFADLAAYAKTWAVVSASADMQKLLAENAKVGAVMQEREILVGIDL